MCSWLFISTLNSLLDVIIQNEIQLYTDECVCMPQLHNKCNAASFRLQGKITHTHALSQTCMNDARYFHILHRYFRKIASNCTIIYTTFFITTFLLHQRAPRRNTWVILKTCYPQRLGLGYHWVKCET